MRKILTGIAVTLGVCFAALAYGQGSAGFQSGALNQPKKIEVNPYVQVGFQRIGSSINLPVGAKGPIAGLLQIDTMDITLKDANMWTGTAGFTAKYGKLMSFFGSAGGSFPRSFIVDGDIPISIDIFSTSAKVDFTASGVEAWYAQTGLGLGPILAGLYWDHFTMKVGEPRRGSTPLKNQTLRGDFVTTTFCPYIGLAVPGAGALAMVIYSPWAMSNSTLALRASETTMAELQYKWDKPGHFVSASIQYDMTLMKSISAGIWGNGTWMGLRGNAELDYENSDRTLSSRKDVTATMTKYVVQGGVTLGVSF